jgi:hypothetical protein
VKVSSSHRPAKATEGGLKHKVFTEIGEQGVPATLLTDQDNKKVIEILVTDGGKGNKDK